VVSTMVVKFPARETRVVVNGQSMPRCFLLLSLSREYRFARIHCNAAPTTDGTIFSYHGDSSKNTQQRECGSLVFLSFSFLGVVLSSSIR